MGQLTYTAFYTRKVVNYAILIVIAVVILQALWGICLSVLRTAFPPKPPPPTHLFGRLPPLNFPTAVNTNVPLTYTLETISGAVPEASQTAEVYFIKKSQANLLALSKTQEFAKKYQFDETPIAESKNIYRFNDLTSPLRKLQYDIVSNNFALNYDVQADPGIFLGDSPPSETVAIGEAKKFLEQGNLYVDDLKKGSVKISYLSSQLGQLLRTKVIGAANATRVDFFRRPIDGLELVTPSPDEGQVAIIFSPNKDPKRRIIQVLYTYWPIDLENKATYSLKSSKEAWDELVSGGGYIARYPVNGKTSVTVRTVRLAYYDSFDPQMYLQPVFLFEGDDEFLGYVSAINPAWVEAPQNTSK